ncbi:unnamed protein product [Trichogramma brassicae]|uniref:Uncharacterized protein n=1 Tax=Trichogramma brassicae TaxID=86971 RepID=A0A6H5HVR5_9HYME|nr:unnamed protein product [Trichogramma brassicae]
MPAMCDHAADGSEKGDTTIERWHRTGSEVHQFTSTIIYSASNFKCSDDFIIWSIRCVLYIGFNQQSAAASTTTTNHHCQVKQQTQ